MNFMDDFMDILQIHVYFMYKKPSSVNCNEHDKFVLKIFTECVVLLIQMRHVVYVALSVSVSNLSSS